MGNNILIIGCVWPEPKSSAAGSRMLQLIRLFKTYHYKITFACAASKTAASFNLQALGVSEKNIQLNHDSFNDFLKVLKPDIVMFDRFISEEQYGWRVLECCPNTLRVLDTEDLHGLRKAREIAYKEGVNFNKSHIFNDTAKREIASIYRCDVSLIISEIEMAFLKDLFNVNEQILYYLPFLLDEITTEAVANMSSFDNRQHFITVGNFLHAPNYQSILNLKEQIWPFIKKQLPQAQLHVYGAYPLEKIKSLNAPKTSFFIKGFVENLDEVMQKAKICLAPLPFGSGLKGKIIDAMINGTPCIMSNIAAEGLFGTLLPNGFIEDVPEKFADKAVALYNDKITWEKHQNNGFLVINNRFNKQNFTTVFLSTLENMLKNLETHRLQNFTGSMLHHHTLQSTKYMSKWIAAKHGQN